MCTNDGDPEGVCRGECGYDENCGAWWEEVRCGFPYGMLGMWSWWVVFADVCFEGGAARV